jgi:hypothetical protein
MGSLAFVDIDELILHEEVIPSLLDSVVSELRATGMLLHPVVVSSQHLMVLDGNHRVEALKGSVPRGCSHTRWTTPPTRSS